MRNATIVLVLLTGCSTDPWVGSYTGSTLVEARDCDTGDPVNDVQDTTLTIERDDRGLFVSGRCLLRLDELSGRTATVVPTSCDFALDDGTPSHIEIVSGRAQLDGSELALEYSAQATSPGSCLTALATFVGERVD